MISLTKKCIAAMVYTTLLATFGLISTSVIAQNFVVTEVASGLSNPWGLAFLPNGDALVTERTGGLKRITVAGKMFTVKTELPPVEVTNQGGMMGIAIDPDFDRNNTVYICLSVKGDGGNGSEVHKGVLSGNILSNVSLVFQALPKAEAGFHYGCRIVFDEQQRVYISLGERSKKDESQNTNNHFGKVVRVNKDGSVPNDNPFVNGDAPEVFTYGHRNVQGMTVHPKSGHVWTNEHGPKGGDEINILKKGINHGWPVITYGVNYNGTSITDITEKDGMAQPFTYWDPSIAPSGMTFYTGNEFHEWKGDLFLGSLKFRYLHHINMEDGNIVSQHELLKDRDERIRDVVQGPDGNLYVLTDDADGKLLKLSKK